MAKLIGTGQDPRFPKGQDYDVRDEEVSHHVDNKLGIPVAPGTEAGVIHAGRDTIADDPSLDEGPSGADRGAYGEHEDNVAARTETTSAKTTPGRSPAGSSEPKGDAASKSGDTRAEAKAKSE